MNMSCRVAYALRRTSARYPVRMTAVRSGASYWNPDMPFAGQILTCGCNCLAIFIDTCTTLAQSLPASITMADNRAAYDRASRYATTCSHASAIARSTLSLSLRCHNSLRPGGVHLP